MKNKINVFWFRRDLRLDDNVALYHALSDDLPVLPIFIFDTNILDQLDDRSDKRVQFIYDSLQAINQQLHEDSSGLLVLHGKPEECFEKLLTEYDVTTVFANEDYEPYAIQRDETIELQLKSKGASFKRFKDHLIFSPIEILKDDGTAYGVFTPYYKKWRSQLSASHLKPFVTKALRHRFVKTNRRLPSLETIGFNTVNANVQACQLDSKTLTAYALNRDIPASNGCTYLSTHLRFGTISVRAAATKALQHSEKLLSELAWREFYANILFHHPHVVLHPLKPTYANIKWNNNEDEFELWCNGQTGFALVDAGMRELNETGLMHNRVRMVTASFLCKHLLIDWRWGEAYFANKLLDFDLASNNGNWQWVAGCGADAAPYFRVFNPTTQAEKFDSDDQYIKRWVPEYNSPFYKPMIDHAFARERVLKVYKQALDFYKVTS